MPDTALEAPRKILVFGASGYVGSNLGPALVARGAARNRAVLENRKRRRQATPNPGSADPYAETTATPAALRQVVTSLVGGQTGYFSMDWIWIVRELAGWLNGGRGFARGRREGPDLRLGDSIDYWTVVGIEPGRQLTPDFGLKAPGAGILESSVEPSGPGHTRIAVTAYWHPQGVWGLLYWAVLVPFHLFIFKGMTRAIARRAETVGKR